MYNYLYIIFIIFYNYFICKKSINIYKEIKYKELREFI